MQKIYAELSAHVLLQGSDFYMADLFASSKNECEAIDDENRPLADRLRPSSLREVVGQRHLLGNNGSLDRMLSSKRLGSLVLWGPPGTGKTTVAQLLADRGVFDEGLKFRSMVLPDTFIDQASPADMYASAGMNAEQIEAKVLDVLGVASIGAQRA